MKVLVNGVGNIGKTILGLLCEYKNLLKIDSIYALKNGIVSDWNREEIKILQEKGVVICSRHDSSFQNLDEIINSIDYIFDCNSNGIGMKNKAWYESLPNLKSCSAQGSEKGFGIPYMSGVNDEIITNSKFAHIVSCNTHALSALLLTLTNNDLSNFIEGDFVVVRRSEDIGNHQRLVTANVISRHLDLDIGTHHAIDVIDLFKTRGVNLNIQSSDITTPSQLMHSVRFNLTLKNMPKREKIIALIEKQSLVSKTSKYDSNIVFELGRRYSAFGRLFSHVIINHNNLLLDYDNNRIKGWSMIPQEGNTILSTIHAYLLQNNLDSEGKIMDKLKQNLIRKEW